MNREEGPGTVTQLLHQASNGNKDAFNKLLPFVYEELKQLARKKLRAEREGHTLNATALVHEAYLKLVDQQEVEWQTRTHFFAIASQAALVRQDPWRRNGAGCVPPTAQRGSGSPVTTPAGHPGTGEPSILFYDMMLHDLAREPVER